MGLWERQLSGDRSECYAAMGWPLRPERKPTIMARPREFDEAAVLDAAIEKFWQRGYEATSVRDLAEEMNIAGASLYNAFGDKRTLYARSLNRYLEQTFRERIRRI